MDFQLIIEQILMYLPHIFAMLSEVGIFFYIKLYLKKKADELAFSKEQKEMNENVKLLISDNAQLRKQNKELIDKLVSVKNGSDYL